MDVADNLKDSMDRIAPQDEGRVPVISGLLYKSSWRSDAMKLHELGSVPSKCMSTSDRIWRLVKEDHESGRVPYR